MADSPSGSAYKKKRHVFGRLKDILPGRNKDKDTRPTTPDPVTPELATSPGANSDPAKAEADNSEAKKYNARDRWQMAYDALSESDRDTLATLLPVVTTAPQDAGRARTREIFDQVVKATETQYKEDSRKSGTRATAHKILNCVLSFQDVVDNVVKFDPTGYASSAWAIVSLGLTVGHLTDKKQT
ncbi:hypothetical protein N7468_006985 [Penicillium chermesinum]|uniref:NWD NACHT-NTPase N-terminal domain-containing protein n=1 Tax=Penicillium chermesinum TaxID=63820 RepID=A0A9W9NTE1_9EURO|nr:uncharacterized protein N7468_006985 [Penicillium chermesinum]KAJ5225760.1 hypothetical protein N7468_006985 [Penicillium chermesinum]